MKIKTNHHWRELVSGYELSDNAKIRKQFDYYNDSEFDELELLQYKGWWYSLEEFMRIPEIPEYCIKPGEYWQGACGESYFSGVLIRFSEDCEQYQIGTYSN